MVVVKSEESSWENESNFSDESEEENGGNGRKDTGKEEKKERVIIWTGKHDRKIALSAHRTNPEDNSWVGAPKNSKRMNVDIVWIRIV